MSTAAIGEEFVVGRCAFCARETLAVADVDGEDTWRCAHCDERLVELRTVDERTVEGLGYEFSSGQEPAASGCTSCGSDGCGVPTPDSAGQNRGSDE